MGEWGGRGGWEKRRAQAVMASHDHWLLVRKEVGG